MWQLQVENSIAPVLFGLIQLALLMTYFGHSFGATLPYSLHVSQGGGAKVWQGGEGEGLARGGGRMPPSE